MLSRVFGAAITGGLSIYVARTKGVEFSGEFFLLVSVLTAMSVVTRLGAEPYLTQQIAHRAHRGPSAYARYLTATTIAVSLMFLLVSGALLVLDALAGGPISGLAGDVPVQYLILACAGINAVWIVGGLARSTGRASTSVFVETGLFSLWLFVILEVFRWREVTPRGEYVAIGVSLLAPLLILPVLASIGRNFRGSFSVTATKEALRGVLGFGAVIITNAVVMLLPLQALGWFGDTEGAGVYNAALRVSMFVGAFGVVFKSVIVRRVSKREHLATRRADDLREAALVTVPWLVLSVLIATQADALSRLFGPEFKGIKSILLIMLIAQCVYVAGNLIETRSVLAGERKLLNVVSLLTFLIGTVSSVTLVGWFGLQGAAWAFLVTIIGTRGLLAFLYVRMERA